MLTKSEINFVLSRAKQTTYYKAITQRNFKPLPGYSTYKEVASSLAALLMIAPEEIYIRTESLDQDPAYADSLHSAWMAYNAPIFPVYAIAKDLANAFLQSDIPSHVHGLQSQFDMALFLFPQGLLKNPDGLPCNWLLVTNFPTINEAFTAYKYNKFLRFISEDSVKLNWESNLNQRKLRWIAMPGYLCSYSNTMELPEQGNSLIKGDFIIHDLFSRSDLSKEQVFTSKIDSLILQTLLYMQLPKQGEVVRMEQPKTVAQHYKRIGFAPNSALNPILIGANYKQSMLRRPHQGGSHASPQTHWRRGFWRNIPVARGVEEKRTVWVRPTLVNG